MSDEKYTIIGAEESPYSVKVRSYFRYKDIPHEWTNRGEAGDLFAKLARLPLIPLVVKPDGSGIQDSTPIIEAMEQDYPQPSIYPDDDTAAFVSTLLEEFGDEWGNKWMFHLRWAREVDQYGCARRLAQMSNPNATDEQLETMTEAVRERMVNRVWFVGSNEVTAPQIEQSFKNTIEMLNLHLAIRPYLFGGIPSFADFGMWGQIYNANRDTTPALWLADYEHVLSWIDRMLNPAGSGLFESWNSLEATLAPILAKQVGPLFLKWSDANARAIAGNQEEFTVELDSGTWEQKPQKYHARSLGVLRKKFAECNPSDKLKQVLSDNGCLAYLES